MLIFSIILIDNDHFVDEKFLYNKIFNDLIINAWIKLGTIMVIVLNLVAMLEFNDLPSRRQFPPFCYASRDTI